MQRQPLSRQRILQTALELVDRDGLEALSMRRLGAELQVEGMSLYNHVPNKDAVLDGIVELLLEEIVILPPDPHNREHAWSEVGRSYPSMGQRHPRAFPLVAHGRRTAAHRTGAQHPADRRRAGGNRDAGICRLGKFHARIRARGARPRCAGRATPP